MSKSRDCRTIVGKFVHSTWGNINIRCSNGKYNHKRTKEKCKIYEDVEIKMSRDEFKKWCWEQQILIESLSRPSLDRIDNNKHYEIGNIQIIELSENIRKKKQSNSYMNGSKSNTKRGIRKSGNGYLARITKNRKERYVGNFKTKEEAYQAFYNEYLKEYGLLWETPLG